MDWHSLIGEMQSGSIRALSRLITLVENRQPGWRSAMKRIYASARSAVTIGITGYPGSGKSTLVGRLVRELVDRGNRVGVVAIDPSSHLTGGAFLGDRIRMNELSALEGVYIRSMGSRGTVGGIHPAARDVVKILDAFGKQYILVETVGVGQDEIDIARATHIVLLVCAPGQGDAIQYLKAGVMEVADIYVANKSDLPEAQQMIMHLQGILPSKDAANRNEFAIVKTNALQGVGIAALADEVEKRVGRAERMDARRRRLAADDVSSLLKERLAELGTLNWTGEAEFNTIINGILTGRTDPYSVADEMIVRGLEHLLKKRQAS